MKKFRLEAVMQSDMAGGWGESEVGASVFQNNSKAPTKTHVSSEKIGREVNTRQQLQS